MRLFLATLAASLIAGPAFAAEPRTVGAVVAADESWDRAEFSGDAAFLKLLLVPGYVSVGPDGRTTTKEKLVARAATKTKADLAKFAQQAATWKAAHPMRSEVLIMGDTAVLKWVSASPASDGAVLSCDIFVYQNGSWHALYSQHSSVSS